MRKWISRKMLKWAGLKRAKERMGNQQSKVNASRSSSNNNKKLK